jgi:hypothetical protein
MHISLPIFNMEEKCNAFVNISNRNSFMGIKFIHINIGSIMIGASGYLCILVPSRNATTPSEISYINLCFLMITDLLFKCTFIFPLSL